MKVKPGVSVRGIQPATVFGLIICHSVFQDLGETLTVTSGTEGSHSWASLHYVGQAFDIRIRDLRNEVARVVERLKSALGKEFDVVLESDHIHIEFQPKSPI